MYIRCGILTIFGRHKHDTYFAGMTPMFKQNMILSGSITDIGGPDGLIPGMIVGSKIGDGLLGTEKGDGVGHGGVYAGLHDFGDGPEHAVYSFNTKTKRGNLRRFTDVPADWVYYGWHGGVVLD